MEKVWCKRKCMETCWPQLWCGLGQCKYLLVTVTFSSYVIFGCIRCVRNAVDKMSFNWFWPGLNFLEEKESRLLVDKAMYNFIVVKLESEVHQKLLGSCFSYSNSRQILKTLNYGISPLAPLIIQNLNTVNNTICGNNAVFGPSPAGLACIMYVIKVCFF